MSGRLANLGKRVHEVGSPVLAVGPKFLAISCRKLFSESWLLLPLWANKLIKTRGQPHQRGSGLVSCLFVTLRTSGHSRVQQSDRSVSEEPPWSTPTTAGSLCQHSIPEQWVLRRAGLEQLSLQISKERQQLPPKKPKPWILSAKSLGS